MLQSWLKNFKGVIFDLDGVLIESTSAWARSIQDVLSGNNFPVPSIEEIKPFIAKTTEEQLRYLIPYKKNSEKENNYLAKKIDDYYIRNIRKWVKLHPGTQKVLETLSKNQKKLSLITNNNRKITDKLLQIFELYRFFDPIITLNEMIRPKPDPSPFLTIIKKWNIDRKELLYIGDSPTDLEASLNSKIPFVLVKPLDSPFSFPIIPPSTIIINEINDLLVE